MATALADADVASVCTISTISRLRPGAAKPTPRNTNSFADGYHSDSSYGGCSTASMSELNHIHIRDVERHTRALEMHAQGECLSSCTICAQPGGLLLGGDPIAPEQVANIAAQKHITEAYKGMKVDNTMTTATLEKRDLINFGFNASKVAGEGQYSRVYAGKIKSYASILEKPGLRKYVRKQCVVKAVSKDLAAVCFSTDKDSASRFIAKELSITITAQGHANVVKFIAEHETPSHVYIFLEKCREDLFTYVCSKGRLREDEARSMFKQFIDGIMHLHNKGIVHRDLKCENILLDYDNNVKITDFGLAAITPNKRKLLKTGCGSLSYAAPELINEEKYDGRLVDIWASGVVLYVMINGSTPFRTNRKETLLSDMHMQRLVFATYCSPEVRFLIRDILQWDPLRRLRLAYVLKHPWSMEQKLSPGKRHCAIRYKAATSLPHRTSKPVNLHVGSSLYSQDRQNTSYSTVSFQQGHSNIKLKSRIPDHTKKRYLQGVDTPDSIRRSLRKALEQNRLARSRNSGRNTRMSQVMHSLVIGQEGEAGEDQTPLEINCIQSPSPCLEAKHSQEDKQNKTETTGKARTETAANPEIVTCASMPECAEVQGEVDDLLRIQTSLGHISEEPCQEDVHENKSDQKVPHEMAEIKGHEVKMEDLGVSGNEGKEISNQADDLEVVNIGDNSDLCDLKLALDRLFECESEADVIYTERWANEGSKVTVDDFKDVREAEEVATECETSRSQKKVFATEMESECEMIETERECEMIETERKCEMIETERECCRNSSRKDNGEDCELIETERTDAERGNESERQNQRVEEVKKEEVGGGGDEKNKLRLDLKNKVSGYMQVMSPHRSGSLQKSRDALLRYGCNGNNGYKANKSLEKIVVVRPRYMREDGTLTAVPGYVMNSNVELTQRKDCPPPHPSHKHHHQQPQKNKGVSKSASIQSVSSSQSSRRNYSYTPGQKQATEKARKRRDAQLPNISVNRPKSRYAMIVHDDDYACHSNPASPCVPMSPLHSPMHSPHPSITTRRAKACSLMCMSRPPLLTARKPTTPREPPIPADQALHGTRMTPQHAPSPQPYRGSDVYVAACRTESEEGGGHMCRHDGTRSRHTGRHNMELLRCRLENRSREGSPCKSPLPLKSCCISLSGIFNNFMEEGAGSECTSPIPSIYIPPRKIM